MNLFNFKKTAFIAGTVLIALFSPQAFAYGYLYCTDVNHDNADWAYVPTGKKLSQEFTDYAYEYPYNGKNYLTLRGSFNALAHGGATFLVASENNKNMSEEQAKRFCQELQSYCPVGTRYVGARYTMAGTRNRVSIPVGNATNRLVCPNWAEGQHTGLIYPQLVSGMEKPYPAGISILTE